MSSALVTCCFQKTKRLNEAHFRVWRKAHGRSLSDRVGKGSASASADTEVDMCITSNPHICLFSSVLLSSDPSVDPSRAVGDLPIRIFPKGECFEILCGVSQRFLDELTSFKPSGTENKGFVMEWRDGRKDRFDCKDSYVEIEETIAVHLSVIKRRRVYCVENVKELWGLQRVAFDKESESHLSKLRTLWDAFAPGEPFLAVSDRWKEFGFQGKDPSTDFRGIVSFFFDTKCIIV